MHKECTVSVKYTNIGKPSARLVKDTSSQAQPTIRSIHCQYLTENSKIRCKICEKYRKTLQAKMSRKRKDEVTTLSSTNSHSESQAICTTTSTSNQHQQVMRSDVQQIINSQQPNSFTHLFWLDQLKNMQALPSGRRWNPLVIKMSLYIHHLSSSAYELMRKSNCLALPSSRTLRDYTHYIENIPGFNKSVDQQLAEMIGLNSLKEHEKFVCIVADEMKIKEGLVFNKHDGELQGFTNLGDMNNDMNSLESSDIEASLATSVFSVMIRGLLVPFNFPYASFPAKNLTGEQIASIMMEATFRMERLGLKVLAHSLDGCSSNRKYF